MNLVCICIIVAWFLVIHSSALHGAVKSGVRSLPQLHATTPNVGAQNLDWPSLGFEYRQTNYFTEIDYKSGEWGPVQTNSDPFVKIHIGATALHYGQACFEGLKAFHCADGKVRIFRPRENAARINNSSKRICMPPLSEELFLEAVRKAVIANLDFVPPYGTGGALYIRPLLYGSGPKIGLQPAEYKFLCLVMPVADYYRGAKAGDCVGN